MDELNAMSLEVFQYLGAHAAVSNLELKPMPGVAMHNISLWNQRNSPKKLPADLVAFLAASNGLSIKWHAVLNHKFFALGHFSINSLQSMKRVDVTLGNATHAGYVLESSSTLGEVCMVFVDDETVQVWLKDLTNQWHFLAKSFSDYYRLMIVHLGLVGWQLRFTPNGLDPVTQQWFHLFVPGRMQARPTDKNEAAPEDAKVTLLPFTL
ncbi:hypothetical protein SPRG_09880 [Saprolegnia parasitica CBS 223.65]|uniref:Knr4/Smi1-like domain-containing protein n=1 Tax=Saprolegnia parasitica (strain CBS 223.65) TaxID=695850 RepID=A0A067C0G5_SAPPC|nr:hypothetical protein SPRG_09880 [Saprolegnia parasitica CBS 223.65]KDO24244.1 hypothetical protein SPRG_09880 [Saprolegnia parasitica CBS 223.65]|eukprot:XP_012205020.1 hypothetical protein SPRG_09880 [Saprolegnia parasitica CBS 223.65]